MHYLNIIILLISTITPSLVYAEQSPDAVAIPDFSKTIFSGKFVPAPPITNPEKNSAASTSKPITTPPTNTEQSSYDANINSQNTFSAFPNPSKIPTINNLNQNNRTHSTASNIEQNYAIPLNATTTAEQAHKIKESEEKAKEQLNAFDKAIKENFNTYRLPQEYYAEPFSKQNQHLPPVHFASYQADLAFKYVKNDDYTNARYFIKRYNFANTYNEEGNNLLMVAAQYNNINTARMLLANHALHINAQNKHNLRSALHIAVMNNSYEMVRLLLNMGASMAITDAEDFTPLDYSILLDNSKIHNLLVAYK
jgi:hypothetical protein